MLNKPMSTLSRPTAAYAQHAKIACTQKGTLQPSSRCSLSSQHIRCVGLVTRKRMAPCRDSTYIAAANRSSQNDAPPGTQSERSKVFLSPRQPLSGQVEGQQPVELSLDQGNGGSSGNGSGGGNGRGDGDGDDSDSSGGSQPKRPFFLRLIGLLFRGPALAILISVLVYNWLQARQRRKQTAARDAGEQSASATNATLLLGDDWPPVQVSAQQEGAAAYGLAEQHIKDRRQREGPLSRLAGVLPWTKDKRKLRQVLCHPPGNTWSPLMPDLSRHPWMYPAMSHRALCGYRTRLRVLRCPTAPWHCLQVFVCRVGRTFVG